MLSDAMALAEKLNKSVQFNTFSKILKSVYPELTTIEVASIYKKALNLGRGILTQESLFLAGEEDGAFSVADRYTVFNKTDYLSRLKKIPDSQLSKEEALFNNEDEKVCRLAKQHSQEGTEGKDMEENFAILTSAIERAIHGTAGEAFTERQNLIYNSLQGLGSLNLLDRYELVTSTLKNPRPRAKDYIGSLGLYLSKWKNLERSILAIRASMLMNQFGSSADEFEYALQLIAQQAPQAAWCLQLHKNVQQRWMLKVRRAKRLQTSLMAMMDSWYKMVVELLNTRKAKQKQEEEKKNQMEKKTDKQLPSPPKTKKKKPQLLKK